MYSNYKNKLGEKEVKKMQRVYLAFVTWTKYQKLLLVQTKTTNSVTSLKISITTYNIEYKHKLV